MKVYIAGKISGLEDYKDNFARAQEMLESEGHIVLNPALLPEGMSAQDYMRICFAMVDSADMVALLPNWVDSRGAALERDYAIYVGKLVRRISFYEALTGLSDNPSVGFADSSLCTREP